MLKKSYIWTASIGSTLVLLTGWLHTAQIAPTPIGDARQETTVALRILFGVQRIHPKTWDGDIALDRGSLLRLNGVYFEHDDAIKGTNHGRSPAGPLFTWIRDRPADTIRYTPSPGN